jgi:phosphoribosylamine---glycine ligase
LFVSGELIAGDLAWRLKEEGCEMRLFIGDESRRDCFDNMVDKTVDWKQELDWVGRDGLIVFDDVGYGVDQDDLRRQGFRVVGGSTGGDRLEQDREFCQQLLAELGMHCPVTRDFEDFDHAIAFVRQNPRRWVIKQDGHTSTLNYVGQLDDGRDVIDILENYRDRLPRVMSTVNLQEFVDGIEIAVGRYFNGCTWVGPIGLNVEHKRL